MNQFATGCSSSHLIRLDQSLVKTSHPHQVGGDQKRKDFIQIHISWTNMEGQAMEEVPISAEDAELPDMVPVSIRTTLPEFQHYTLERVLAGVLLTWQEFLQLFDIRVEVTEYIIRGSNGVQFDLNKTVQDYVDTFRRKLKMYSVTLERSATATETYEGQKVTTNIEGKVDRRRTRDKNMAAGSAGSAKKPKLMDEDKRKKRNHRTMTKESLEKIAQSVMQGQAVAATATRTGATKGDNKRDFKAGSPTSPTGSKKDNADGASNSTDLSAVLQRTEDSQLSGGKLKRDSTDRNEVKDPSTSSLAVIKRGRKPRKTRTVSSRRSTKESRNTVVSRESDEEDSSESDDEEAPTKDKKKLLKQNVIKYLTEKVSPRSFLRLRKELIQLRDEEKYFKVTSVVPMTAGMMEQAFCRKLTE